MSRYTKGLLFIGGAAIGFCGVVCVVVYHSLPPDFEMLELEKMVVNIQAAINDAESSINRASAKAEGRS